MSNEHATWLRDHASGFDSPPADRCRAAADEIDRLTAERDDVWVQARHYQDAAKDVATSFGVLQMRRDEARLEAKRLHDVVNRLIRERDEARALAEDALALADTPCRCLDCDARLVTADTVAAGYCAQCAADDALADGGEG